MSEIVAYIQIPIAAGGWWVLYRIFKSEGFFRNGIGVWFGIMAIGAAVAVGGAVARIVSDHRIVEDWAGWVSIAGLVVEGSPLLLGAAVGSKRRR